MSNVTEKGFSGDVAENSAEKVAHCISVLANPLFVALPLFLLVAWRTAPDIWHALLWWAVTTMGVTVVPYVFIRRGVRKGTYTDEHISVREQRLVPLSVGLGSMVLVFLALLLLGATRSYMASLLAACVSLALALAITQLARYKVSLHMAGMTGSVAVCILLVSPWFVLLSPLILLTGWARWQVHAHTVLQAALGVLLAVLVTWGTFWLLRII
jgi:hypothetical protein